MPIVTSLKPQRNQKRINVYLDGEFSFGIDLDNLVKFGIKIEKEFSKTEIKKIINTAEFHKTYMKLLNFVTFRPRSEKEVYDWFKRKEVPKSIHGKLIKKVKKLELLDDLKFARWWVEQRQTFKPRGMKALIMELRQKGISSDIIKDALAETSVDDTKVATALYAKNLHKWQRFDPEKQKEKAISFLARKGFDFETIKSVVKYREGE